MPDSILARPGTSLIGDIIWQSSLFLLVGLAVTAALRRRPARAHVVLVLAIFGALIAPLCSQLVRRAGWGLGTVAVSASWPRVTETPPRTPASEAVRPAAVSQELRGSEGMSTQIVAAASRAESGLTLEGEGELRPSGHSRFRAVVSERIPQILATLWCVVSGLCLARLIGSMVAGWRAVGRASPVTGESMTQAVGAARARLALRVQPDLLASRDVTCPAIWCWRRRPAIVLPKVADTVSVDWIGVFCHELAHWRRRDHVWSLLADVLVCAVPFQPLAWWARRRLGQLSELACDDWAIAGGRDPESYAETLLQLLPRRRTLSALAAVSRRSGLAARIAHLLTLSGPVEPRSGRVWISSVSLAAIGLVAVIALTQARGARPRSDEVKKPNAGNSLAAESNAKGDQVMRRTVRGTVRDVSGKPVEGAEIVAVGWLESRERRNGWYFTHHGEEPQILAQAASDRDGKFVLELALDAAVDTVHVIARLTGMGLTARNYSARPPDDGDLSLEVLNDRPVELTLLPNVPIEGRLLSQTGNPVRGVSVALTMLELGDGPDGFAVGAPETDEGRPVKTPYWPEPVVTDGEGRFRLDGLCAKGVARITVIHDAYIHELLVISTEPELSGYRKAWQTKPVQPRFTHVLETARPIVGIVSDKDTGRPLAGIRVEIGATGGEPGLPYHFPATTDALGRYRITGIAWNYPRGLHAQLLPDATSGYIPEQHQHEEWPAGAAELRWNLTLKKGALVRGRVIDVDSKRPIPAARVAGERINQTVLTDALGTFSICVDPRYRSLFVEGPTPDYRRMTVPKGEVESTDGVYYPHGYARVIISPEGTPAPVEIALRKGAAIAAQAVDLEGAPLADVWVSGEPLFVQSNYSGAGSGRCSRGLFRAASFEPGQTCRVFFIHDERHLAGFADLTAQPQPTAPVNVTLRGTARVRGKLLRPDGTPDRHEGVSAYFLLSPDEVKVTPMDFLRGDRVMSYGTAAHRGGLTLTNTDENGEFEVGDLLAGVKNYVAFWPLTSNEIHYIPVDGLKPGEARDLGSVKPIVLTEKR
jgi:beta-lactamase regulating signal transducer with metallopeptidase domain